MFETIEAIQADIEGVGIILYPGSPDNPPSEIAAMDLMYVERVFDAPNPLAPTFPYKYYPELYKWRLQSSIP